MECRRKLIIKKPDALFSALILILLPLFLSIPSAVSSEYDPNTAQSNSPSHSGLLPNLNPSKKYSLSECFAKAARDNKDIIVASKNLPIAKAGIKIAGAIPNPLLAVQIGFGPSFTYLYTGQTQQLFLTQELQTAGKRRKNIDLARANYTLTEVQLKALRFDVHNRVRRAYAELAAAEAYENLIEDQREVSIRLAQIAKNRFDAGKAPKSELLQAQLNVLQFDIQRNQAQGRLQQDTAVLSQIIGDKPEHVEVFDVNDNGIFKLSSEKTDIVPEPSRSLPTLDELLTAAFSSSPSLKVTQQQVLANRKALTLARAQRIPDLFLGFGFTFSTFARNQPNNLVSQPNWLGNALFMNVTAENPLFYQHQGEILQALANVQQAERQEDLLKSQVATATIVAYNSVSTAQENIFIFQRDLLPTAAQIAKLARRGYEVGKTDLATAIIAQQQYQQTLSNYFDAVVAYQNAWADLEKAVGLPLKY